MQKAITWDRIVEIIVTPAGELSIVDLELGCSLLLRCKSGVLLGIYNCPLLVAAANRSLQSRVLVCDLLSLFQLSAALFPNQTQRTRCNVYENARTFYRLGWTAVWMRKFLRLPKQILLSHSSYLRILNLVRRTDNSNKTEKMYRVFWQAMDDAVRTITLM